jgi:hypothetical protein
MQMRSSFYRGMIILIQLFLIACFPAVKDVYAQTFIVKQNGTGDYSIIQDAVDVAQIGDTVLVYPGTYYENIDLTDKGIVLASTWLLNHQDSLIQSTIIDGNQNGSCIKSESGEHLSEIIGFTMQHGNGTNYLESMYPYLYGSGGGVYASESNLVISHCNIVNNFGRHGGGLLAGNSSVLLSNNTFTGNWAVGQGGGIMTYSSKVIYDSIYLNNVYLNFSSAGSDIAIFYNDTISTIWLDTCTVQNPDQYYIGKFSDWAIHIERPPVSVLHGKIEQANQDLFVSTSGNDTNSGFTPDEPLKTISYALVKIASDSMDMKTIHVANGIYSNTLTGEHIPLQLKNWVNLKGDSRENTIIDCEEKYEGARFAFGQDFTHLKNMTFLEGNGFPIMLNGGLSSGYSQKLILDSISFVGTTGDVWAAIYSDSDDSLIVKNSIFKDCSSHYAVNCHVKNYDSPRYNEFVSCIFAYNHVDTAVIPEWEGRHVSLGLSGSEFDFGWNKTLILNCLFNDNLDSFVWNGSGGAAAISTYEGCQVEIINSTFANNLTINNPSGGAVGASGNSTVNFTNSILYDNYACQAYLSNDNENRADTMIINNTLVQNGLEGIRDYGSFNHLVWAENNLDADPMFIGSENYPYAIDFDSPCIDAGTLNLPPGIELPEYDLAGNPRIWGESVDIGAYEYGPWVGVKEDRSQKAEDRRQVEISPNPFSYGTYISYTLLSSGKLNISVYSISGMKVRTLENHQASKGDTGKFYWNGSDQQGNDLPAGVYLIRMTIDGKEVETVKAVKGER